MILQLEGVIDEIFSQFNFLFFFHVFIFVFLSLFWIFLNRLVRFRQIVVGEHSVSVRLGFRLVFERETEVFGLVGEGTFVLAGSFRDIFFESIRLTFSADGIKKHLLDVCAEHYETHEITELLGRRSVSFEEFAQFSEIRQVQSAPFCSFEDELLAVWMVIQQFREYFPLVWEFADDFRSGEGWMDLLIF